MIPIRVVFGDDRPGLHRVDHDPVVDDPHVDLVGCGLEGVVHAVLVAVDPVERNIVGDMVVKLRNPGLG